MQVWCAPIFHVDIYYQQVIAHPPKSNKSSQANKTKLWPALFIITNVYIIQRTYTPLYPLWRFKHEALLGQIFSSLSKHVSKLLQIVIKLIHTYTHCTPVEGEPCVYIQVIKHQHNMYTHKSNKLLGMSVHTYCEKWSTIRWTDLLHSQKGTIIGSFIL